MSEPLEAQKFNWRVAREEMSRSTPNFAERKLHFHEQCAIFAALYSHKIKPDFIRRAFGVTPTTVSNIAGCLSRDPNPWRTEFVSEAVERRASHDFNRNRSPNRVRRYPAVAAEFLTLGEEEFNSRYYTEEIHLRLMRVKYDRDNEAQARARGPSFDPAANLAAGLYKLAGLAGDTLTVVVTPIPGEGWTYGGPHYTKPVTGRYRTSDLALAACLTAEYMTSADIIEGPLPLPEGVK